jgi:HSP20 family protein
MDPIRKLRTEVERSVARAWESLTEGWREIITRGNGALTQFVVGSKQEKSGERTQDFPRWGLLASECWETARAVIVRIELPGIRREDVKVSVSRGRLRISGKKHYSHNAEPRTYHLMERAFGRFERSIDLPADIDAREPELAYDDGVITVILPKREPTPPSQSSIT